MSFVGSRWPLDGPSVSATVLDTGGPRGSTTTRSCRARWPPGARLGNPFDRRRPDHGRRERLGVMTVGTLESEFAGDTEQRLNDFTELAAIAISNAESRDRFRRLADEQAALRRVATLVAEGSTAFDSFDVVACADPLRHGPRFAAQGYPGLVDRQPVEGGPVERASMAVGSRWPLDGPSISATVAERKAGADRRLFAAARHDCGRRPRFWNPYDRRGTHHSRRPDLGGHVGRRPRQRALAS